jgi:nitrogen fixation NifU-like protein
MSEHEDLEKFAQALQEQILAQARQEYSEAVIERWLNPRNMGKMEAPDGYGKVTGPCGDTIEIFLRMRDDIIAEATWLTDGCGATVSCATMATELVKGKTFTQALAAVSTDEIIKRLGGLPEAHLHCAQLASESLRSALADFLHQQKSPWKRPYRKT